MVSRNVWTGLSLLALVLFALTGFWNIGIIALDDYAQIIAWMVPAQDINLDELIATSGFRSPLPPLMLVAVTKALHSMGVQSPILQLRIVLMFLGMLNVAVGIFAARRLFAGREKLALLAALLWSFYFVMPLFLTRPMIESLCTPYLVLSALFATFYYRTGRVADIGWATFFLVVASLFRFQAGVCVLALAATLVLRFRWQALLCAVSVGAVGVWVTGYVDLVLKGGFHTSLFQYVEFNRAHSSAFGVTPFYTYLLLFVGLSFPPVLVNRYSKMDWKAAYKPLLPWMMYFVVFLVVHSMIPHKEERFMIPALPFFLFLIVPMVAYLWEQGKRRRFYWAGALNVVLLIAVVINIPQYNVIGMVQYLEAHDDINSVVSVDKSIILFPEAYLSRDVEISEVGAISKDSQARCDEVYAFRMDKLNRLDSVDLPLKRIATFVPGPLEALIVKANPGKNARRGPLHLYGRAECVFAE